MIATKGRYALRVLVDLAEHGGEGYVTLRDVAQRQEISEKYLESIVKSLVRAGMLERLRGKDLFVQREKLSGIPEDTFFIQDLEGLCVVDEEGRPVGTLSAVLQRSAQDLYEITKEDGKTFLLPAVKEFVRQIDLEAGTLTVRLIEGISDL